jgi:hypothetical protein
VLSRITVLGAGLPRDRLPDSRNPHQLRGVPFYFGGTSLLIVVSVTMDTGRADAGLSAGPSIRRADQAFEAAGAA